MKKQQPNWRPSKAEYWKNLPAPARPWPSEVKWFEKYALIKKKQNKKDVLILGSTVEFRSMLHKHKMNVHVVDFSREFYKILSRQPMKYKGREIVCIQNWLTMDLGKKFDLIFGDWVPGVLHTKDYDQFFQNILRHLKDGGLFIGRECLMPKRGLVDIVKVAKRHYRYYAKKYSFYETSMQYMYGYRLDPKTHLEDLPASYRAIEMIHNLGIMADKDYDFCRRALDVESGTLSILYKKDFEKWAGRYFKIITERHVKEPSSECYPIYVMKKK